MPAQASELTVDQAASIGARRCDPRSYARDQYIRHTDLFGPECVLDQARHDLTPTEFAKLTAYVEHRLGVEEWKHGGWVSRRSREPRKCACGCRLDLPAKAPSSRLYRTRACQMRAQRQRDGNQGGLAPENVTANPPEALGRRDGNPGGSGGSDQPDPVTAQSRDICGVPDCGRMLPLGHRSDALYCSDVCRKRAQRAKARS